MVAQPTLLYVTEQLLQGFGVTCLIFGVTLLCALPLGLGVAFCSMSKYRLVRYISKTFVWIIRSTPLLLQVIIVFYGPGLIWGAEAMGRITAVLVAFIINYAAYFSEVYRGGIESIAKGQYEAGQVLGMTRSQIFFKVILLQVVKRILPPMSNEIITLVKDTALARVIAVKEIIMFAQEFVSVNALIWPLFYSGVFYLAFCGILTILFGKFEKRLGYFRA
ncbi:MAG: amino acid ABC transporter permease [Clostridiales bacterium]|nr:amino acid ABC transporter permease [Clostridiales bacterium]